MPESIKAEKLQGGETHQRAKLGDKGVIEAESLKIWRPPESANVTEWVAVEGQVLEVAESHGTSQTRFELRHIGDGVAG